MRGILGTPLKRGNSDVIEAATYTGTVVAGAAVSEATASDEGQLSVVAFDAAKGFAGFALANDLNDKNMTVSTIKQGLDIPVAVVTGKTFVSGGGVFIDATGTVVPEGDAGAVYQVNGSVRRASFTGLDNTGSEKEAITVDLFGGGAAVV